MAQFESLLWERHRQRLPRMRPPLPARLPADPRSEFRARPLGRLGRPLLEEVEAYLEFFALAREDRVEGRASFGMKLI